MNLPTASRPAGAGAIDMRDPAFRHDPHPLLRSVRERGRAEQDVVGTWLVTHHADASAALRSRELSREFWRMPLYQAHRPYLADSTLERVLERWMLFADPPSHTRLRGLVSEAFKPRVVEALQARVTAITDELLHQLPPAGDGHAPFDLITGLAQPLPVRVVCDLLGLPHEDFGQTKQWVDALAVVLEPVVRRADRVAANSATEDMVAYLRGQIAARLSGPPRDDVLGMMLAAWREGAGDGASAGQGEAACSEDELLGNLILLFIAGHETTTNLIGNGVLTLLQHPQELARLRADATLAPLAVEEVLRYEGSVSMVNRFTLAPYVIGDTVVPAGQTLMFMFSAVNRDPAVFSEPERFDITRSHNPHLAFGAGIHFCLGARLARLEGEIAFNRLLARYPQLALAEDTPRWRKLINLRGLESLPLLARRQAGAVGASASVPLR